MTPSDAPDSYQNAGKHAGLHYSRKLVTLSGFMVLGVTVGETLAVGTANRITSGDYSKENGSPL